VDVRSQRSDEHIKQANRATRCGAKSEANCATSTKIDACFKKNSIQKNKIRIHQNLVSYIFTLIFTDAYFGFSIMRFSKLSKQNAHALKRYFIRDKDTSFYLISNFF